FRRAVLLTAPQEPPTALSALLSILMAIEVHIASKCSNLGGDLPGDRADIPLRGWVHTEIGKNTAKSRPVLPDNVDGLSLAEHPWIHMQCFVASSNGPKFLQGVASQASNDLRSYPGHLLHVKRPPHRDDIR